MVDGCVFLLGLVLKVVGSFLFIAELRLSGPGSDVHGVCCPICGMPLRPCDLETHYTQELEYLAKLSAALLVNQQQQRVCAHSHTNQPILAPKCVISSILISTLFFPCMSGHEITQSQPCQRRITRMQEQSQPGVTRIRDFGSRPKIALGCK